MALATLGECFSCSDICGGVGVGAGQICELDVAGIGKSDMFAACSGSRWLFKVAWYRVQTFEQVMNAPIMQRRLVGAWAVRRW